MGSENGAGDAALAAVGADIAPPEPAVFKDEAVEDREDARVENTLINDISHDVQQGGLVNGSNGDVGSGWLNASSPEGSGSGWISADGAPVTLPPSVASQPWPSSRQRTVYLIRIPRSVDEKLRNEIKSAEAKLEQTIKKRDAHKAALQGKKNIKMELLEKLKPIRDKERACREALQGKRMELEPFSAALNKFRSAHTRGQDICSSEEQLNDKIAEIEFRIQHESMPLKEEKQLLREIKQLESTRSQVSANSVLQAELMENLGPKEEIQDQAKFIRQDLDTIRKEHRQAHSEYDAIDKEINKLNEAIEELRQQYDIANAAQQDAYVAVRELKRQENSKNDPFYQNKRDVQAVRELASQKKAKEVEEISTKQVEDFMALWNTDSKFRAEYVKSNERSTVRRLETLDGRALGPNEKPPVLSDDALPSKARDAKPAAETPAPGPSKVAKPAPSGAEFSNGAPLKEPKQDKPSSVHGREDEAGDAGDAGVRATSVKSRQIDASEDAADLEAKAAEQKEKLRQEQIAKAKEAEERKRKRSDKLESRALARAKKDEERREKERERKAQKKASATSSTDPTSANEGAELPEQKPPADAEPATTIPEEASKSTTNVSNKDRKGSASRRKLPAKDAKATKPLLSKRASKKAAWPAPLWAIVSISALVLLVALILYMKL